MGFQIEIGGGVLEFVIADFSLRQFCYEGGGGGVWVGVKTCCVGVKTCCV